MRAPADRRMRGLAGDAEQHPVAAVVLAAGAATRFGAAKQGVLLGEILERVRQSGEIGEIVVVSGAYELEAAAAQLVRCDDWQLGPGASLRCGLRALADGTAAAAVILADGPDLAPAAVDRVLGAWRAHGDDVLAASYGGERGHPVLLARAAWSDVPDEGARALAPLLVPCDDLGAPGDVDYPDDLPERLRGEF